MGNIPLTPQANVQIQYKPVFKSVVLQYMQQIKEYNQQFKNIASLGANNQVQLSKPISQLVYNPPRPVWVNGEDPYFITDIVTYNNQIQAFERNRNDVRMLEVLNTPPFPRPPPSMTVMADPEPKLVGNAQNYLQNDNNSNIPGYDNYRLMYITGTRYLAPGQTPANYRTVVFFDPPQLGETYEQVLDRYVRLYDQIRQLHAINTGREVFDMPFISPNYTISTIEKFVNSDDDDDAAAANTTNIDRCVNVNTDQENWYINQIVDIQGKFDVQRSFCKTKGFDYDATKCGIQSCLIKYDSQNTVSPPEPQTSQQYNYNKLSFSASGFPTRLDQTNYAAKLASMDSFKVDDIEKYYNFLNDYNFFWVNQDGWRQIDDPKRPYNPPMPPWEDKAFSDKVTAYNTSVLEKIRKFNNYEQINLPNDFGTVPTIPTYPNALYELLTKPKLFLTPVSSSTIGRKIDTAPANVRYDVPVSQLPILYEAAKKKIETPQPPASRKPKCDMGTTSGSSQVCVAYDDELSDAAKLLLKDMEGKRTKLHRDTDVLMHSAGTDNPFAMERLQNYYNRISEDIKSTVREVMRNS